MRAKKKAPAKVEQAESCPNCGYCPHCKRAAPQPITIPILQPSTYPWYPWWGQPTWIDGTEVTIWPGVPSIGTGSLNGTNGTGIDFNSMSSIQGTYTT